MTEQRNATEERVLELLEQNPDGLRYAEMRDLPQFKEDLLMSALIRLSNDKQIFANTEEQGSHAERATVYRPRALDRQARRVSDYLRLVGVGERKSVRAVSHYTGLPENKATGALDRAIAFGLVDTTLETIKRDNSKRRVYFWTGETF